MDARQVPKNVQASDNADDFKLIGGKLLAESMSSVPLGRTEPQESDKDAVLF